MSSSERAALNAPRQSSMSSQMAAIAASRSRDEDSPPPSGAIKGKLDNIKHEDCSKDIKQEDGDSSSNHMEGGKGIKSEIKSEIKQEPMDEGEKEEMRIKEEIRIKEEMRSPSGDDVKQNLEKLGDRKMIIKPDELRQALLPTLEKLYRQDPESLPFRQPVDPQALGIPDYFDIVKKAMDLSTIKRKLDTGQYMDAWEYVDDVWLMFDNAWLYNRKTSRVYRYCTKVSISCLLFC